MLELDAESFFSVKGTPMLQGWQTRPACRIKYSKHSIPGHSILGNIPIMAVVYFDQLSGAARTQKLVKLLFQLFLTFFVNFIPFTVISRLKSTKTRKLVEIQNIWPPK